MTMRECEMERDIQEMQSIDECSKYMVENSKDFTPVLIVIMGKKIEKLRKKIANAICAIQDEQETVE